MGLVKSDWMEAQERGWSAPETYVCADCVEDPYLKQQIDQAKCASTCDYCGRKADMPIAAPTEVVVEVVFGAVRAYYCEPSAGGVPYDQGFIVEPIAIEEVLDHLGFDGHPDLVEAVADSEINGDMFVPAANGYWADVHPHQALSYAWRHFVHVVKHETRFHFAHRLNDDDDGTDEIAVARTLPALVEWLRPLVRTLPKGTQVHRTRLRKRGETWTPTAEAMGAPPPDKTSAGRMNPPGIPYFYGSFDKATARREVGITGRTSRTVYSAMFELATPLVVVDLTQLPAVPSVFDVASKDDREQALFVRQFVDEISVPVTKDGQEHIEYVPTQVVCEYLAQVFEPRPGTRLGGLVFPSSVHLGGKNLVVFPDDRYAGSYRSLAFVRTGK